MMRRPVNRSVGCGLALGTVVFAQESAPPPKQELPWAVRLGMRVAEVEARIPVIDQVVLVPDTATYLDELSHWSLAGRWPVLFEDTTFAPQFVRAFKPARVVRRSAVGGVMPTGEALQQRMNTVVAAAWSGPKNVGAAASGAAIAPTGPPATVAATDPKAAFAAVGFVPAGVVFTSTSDLAWTAALALAAGRGQPLCWLDGNFGIPSDELDATRFTQIAVALEKGVDATGYGWGALGDPIDTVTICRSMAAKVRRDDAAVALTDSLCRRDDRSRWAVASWVFGNEVRSAFMAMSSLFAPREDFWLMNSYGSDKPWSEYAMDQAGQMLTTAHWKVTHMAGAQVSVTGWLNAAIGGFPCDVLLLNSMGNWDFFQLFEGKYARPEDIPLLSHPLALHMIHSWSLRYPDQADTVGATWLDHGVYSYAGSVYEPGLGAFVPPTVMAARLATGAPFLVAARWLEGPMDYAWRVTLIGDPLMIIEPPGAPLRKRTGPTSASAQLAPGSVSLREEVRDLLKRTKAGNQAAWSGAMRDLILLGDDKLALELWTLASRGPAAADCAALALGPLLRARDRDGLLGAFRLVKSPSDAELDMLWAAWTSYLNQITDAQTLTTLAAAVRQPRPQTDLERLLPAIRRVQGAEVARAAVSAALDQTTKSESRRALKDLRDSIQ